MLESLLSDEFLGLFKLLTETVNILKMLIVIVVTTYFLSVFLISDFLAFSFALFVGSEYLQSFGFDNLSVGFFKGNIFMD